MTMVWVALVAPPGAARRWSAPAPPAGWPSGRAPPAASSRPPPPPHHQRLAPHRRLLHSLLHSTAPPPPPTVHPTHPVHLPRLPASAGLHPPAGSRTTVHRSALHCTALCLTTVTIVHRKEEASHRGARGPLPARIQGVSPHFHTLSIKTFKKSTF